jgi:thioredoxin reductase
MRSEVISVAPQECDVLIVGGGPAGLTAAANLATQNRVIVLEREKNAGGIPRHSDHTGYGVRDLHRVMSGPEYARVLVEKAMAAGAEIRTESMMTSWEDDHTVAVTSPSGRYEISAAAIVLATGARERPRSARLVAGDRPAGVFTTGALQNLVHLHHRSPGTRAVVVGSELVSWSAVLTMREAGCETIAMITERDRPESYAAFHQGAKVALSTPVSTHTRVRRILGRERVEGVEVENVITGSVKTLACDTIVLTGDWIPDNELVRLGGIDLNHGSLGPQVDTTLRTSRPGVFAIGNLVHPVDTADVCALDGRHVATSVRDLLNGRAGSSDALQITVEPPLRWISPSVVRQGDRAPSRRRLLLWTDEYRPIARLTSSQGGTVVSRITLPWPAAPGRVLRVPWSFLSRVDPNAGPVTVALT